MHHGQHSGGVALAEPPALSIEEQQLVTEEFGLDEFDLDVRVLVTLAPIGRMDCPTDDGCGNTCGGNASSCNSSMNAWS